ncbi:MAG: trypsin-like peptidase domain-containing protein [Pseudomonadota bacterium]
MRKIFLKKALGAIAFCAIYWDGAVGAQDLQQVASVFGRDDREDPLLEEVEHMQWLGVVYSRESTGGATALIVSPSCNVILTAAHVFFDEKGRPWDDEYLFYHLGVTAVAGRALDLDNMIVGDKLWDENPEKDWIVVKLKEPVENCTYQRVTEFDSLGEAVFEDEVVEMVAFHGDDNFTELPKVVRECSFIKQRSNRYLGKHWEVVAHDCDAVGGASGGALIHKDSGSLIAIHPGGFYEHGLYGVTMSMFDLASSPNMAIKVTPEILAAIEQLSVESAD